MSSLKISFLKVNNAGVYIQINPLRPPVCEISSFKCISAINLTSYLESQGHILFPMVLLKSTSYDQQTRYHDFSAFANNVSLAFGLEALDAIFFPVVDCIGVHVNINRLKPIVCKIS